MSKKKFPSLQFINRDRMSLLLTPPTKWSVNAFKVLVDILAEIKILLSKFKSCKIDSSHQFFVGWST
jgi:hypothetical protein